MKAIKIGIDIGSDHVDVTGFEGARPREWFDLVVGGVVVGQVRVVVDEDPDERDYCEVHVNPEPGHDIVIRRRR